jgi:hypothetical protein
MPLNSTYYLPNNREISVPLEHTHECSALSTTPSEFALNSKTKTPAAPAPPSESTTPRRLQRLDGKPFPLFIQDRIDRRVGRQLPFCENQDAAKCSDGRDEDGDQIDDGGEEASEGDDAADDRQKGKRNAEASDPPKAPKLTTEDFDVLHDMEEAPAGMFENLENLERRIAAEKKKGMGSRGVSEASS